MRAAALLFALIVSHAAAASTEGVKARVEDELLKEGLSLDRLDLALDIQVLANSAYLVELTETKLGKSVAMRKIRDLTDGEEAVIAKLTVVVSEMIKERTKTAVPKSEEVVVTQSPPSDAPAKKEEPGGLLVNIKADNPEVVLFRHVGNAIGTVYGAGGIATVSAMQFEQVCKAPCDRRIDVSDGREYFLGGRGVTPTDTFSLTSYNKAVTLDVEAGSANMRLGGYWMSGLGFVSATLGGLFYLLAEPADPSNPDTIGFERQEWMLAALIGGVVVMVPGIIMSATSGTDYELAGE